MNDSAIREEIIKKFNDTINTSLIGIENILENVLFDKKVVNNRLNKIITESSANLVSKWENNEKILRTDYIYRLIPNYPEEILELSLVVDAVVNLLDDLYDEILTKEKRALVVIELLRLFPFIIKSYSSIVRLKTSEYFNKILTVAIIESIYRELIECTEDFNEKLKYCVECYNCKSKDIDLFVELPLLELGISEESIKNTVSIFNVYRALSIISKDIMDVNHDLANQTYTPILLLAETETDSKKYLDYIANYYNDVCAIDFVNEKDPFLETLCENVKKDIQNLIMRLRNQPPIEISLP